MEEALSQVMGAEGSGYSAGKIKQGALVNVISFCTERNEFGYVNVRGLCGGWLQMT